MKVNFILITDKGYVSEEMIATLDIPSPPSIGATVTFKDYRYFKVKTVSIDYRENVAEVIVT